MTLQLDGSGPKEASVHQRTDSPEEESGGAES